MEPTVYHIPAMLDECMQALDIKKDGIYADVTFGGGGHSRAILSHLGPQGRLIGFDQDIDALANALPDRRFTFVRSNFRFVSNFLRYHGISHVDGILADLGVSFHHFDQADRGFSFRADAPLDMRMNRSASLTAATVLATYSDERLSHILRLWGDLRKSAPIVKAILQARAREPILTTGRLAEVIRPAVNPKREKAEMAQVFQALRIEVNDEMQALQQFLTSTLRILRPGGRLVVITYHSLEDRMVKNFMRTGRIDGVEEKDFFGRSLSPWRLITRQPLTPSPGEVESNPRSRSAKMRATQRLPEAPQS